MQVNHYKQTIMTMKSKVMIKTIAEITFAMLVTFRKHMIYTTVICAIFVYMGMTIIVSGRENVSEREILNNFTFSYVGHLHP